MQKEKLKKIINLNSIGTRTKKIILKKLSLMTRLKLEQK